MSYNQGSIIEISLTNGRFHTRFHAQEPLLEVLLMTGSYEELGKLNPHDHRGKLTNRNRFVWGSFSLASALALVAGISARVAAATQAGETPSKAISGVGIFAIFLFGWIFSFVYTPNQV